MEDKLNRFLERTYRIMNKYNGKTKKPKTYGNEIYLHSAEVHMIEVIGSHEAITASEVAKILGISRSAVSQTITKLMEKELIQKQLIHPTNNEIALCLTKEGKNIYLYHLEYHKTMLDELNELADKLPEDSLTILQDMLDVIEHSLDQY